MYLSIFIFIFHRVMAIILHVFNYVSPRYSFEGVLQALYGFDRENLNCARDDPRECLLMEPKVILKQFDVENGMFYLDVVLLVVFFFVFRFCSFLVLKWKVKVR